MAELTIENRPTHDPNVMKFVAGKTLNPTAAMAFYDAESAQTDDIARRFFEIAGVAGLMVVNDFCSVAKSSDADWDKMTPRIHDLIRAHWC